MNKYKNMQTIYRDVLTNLKVCLRMTMKGINDCRQCSIKAKDNCYSILLRNAIDVIEDLSNNSASNFVEYLKEHKDGTLMNWDGSQPLEDIIDISTLDDKLKEFEARELE
jgi:hypothetical protein